MDEEDYYDDYTEDYEDNTIYYDDYTEDYEDNTDQDYYDEIGGDMNTDVYYDEESEAWFGYDSETDAYYEVDTPEQYAESIVEVPAETTAETLFKSIEGTINKVVKVGQYYVYGTQLYEYYKKMKDNPALQAMNLSDLIKQGLVLGKTTNPLPTKQPEQIIIKEKSNNTVLYVALGGIALLGLGLVFLLKR